MEIWDAYDEDFNKISNMTLVRGEPVPDGIFHLVCDIIVRHTDGDYLLMERDARKHLGGMWEATAGGSALQGETPLDCAVRELQEETGIVSNDLIEIGQVIDSATHSIYVEYLCITSCDKESIILQEGETSGYKWVSRDELINMRSELATERILQFVDLPIPTHLRQFLKPIGNKNREYEVKGRMQCSCGCEQFEITQSNKRRIINLQCAQCGQEILLFDEGRHGWNGFVCKEDMLDRKEPMKRCVCPKCGQGLFQVRVYIASQGRQDFIEECVAYDDSFSEEDWVDGFECIGVDLHCSACGTDEKDWAVFETM